MPGATLEVTLLLCAVLQTSAADDEDAALADTGSEGADARTLSPAPLVGLDAVETDTGVLTNEPPPAAQPKEMLQPIDLEPFRR